LAAVERRPNREAARRARNGRDAAQHERDAETQIEESRRASEWHDRLGAPGITIRAGDQSAHAHIYEHAGGCVTRTVAIEFLLAKTQPSADGKIRQDRSAAERRSPTTPQRRPFTVT
jgi:hypothetical protein